MMLKTKCAIVKIKLENAHTCDVINSIVDGLRHEELLIGDLI